MQACARIHSRPSVRACSLLARLCRFFKREPYEVGMPRLFRRKVAESNASADVFAAEAAAFCKDHACSP